MRSLARAARGQCKTADVTCISRLTRTYNARINALTRCAIATPVFETLVRVLRPFLRALTPATLDAAAHDMFCTVLSFVHSLLSYATEFGGQLRQHLATGCDIVAEVVIPCVPAHARVAFRCSGPCVFVCVSYVF